MVGTVEGPAEARTVGVHRFLIARASGLGIALPLPNVGETMRPQAVKPLPGMPPYVLGLSRIRGQAIPVVHLGALLGAATPAPAGRFVTVDTGGRRVALAVDAVIGVRRLDADALGRLPPLLGGVPGELVEALGVMDKELLVVLRAARILPTEVWERLAAAAAETPT
jgi:purine-binding chemotaxis protein CheW